MKPQIFAVVALLAACGTDPAADVPTDRDAGADASDAAPDVVADVADVDDTAVDTTADVAADTEANADTIVDAVADTPDLEPDTEPDVIPDVVPDTGETVTLRGWYSQAFEHSGIIPEDEVNNASFDSGCTAYLIPLEDGEQWWTVTSTPPGLALHPAPHNVGFERVGLVEATGVVHNNGPTGHLGQYDRDFDLQDSTLFACETVERLPHCLTPRTDDLCFTGLDVEGLTVRHELVEILPGPMGNTEVFELRIITGENVGDGRTDLVLHFNVERADHFPEDDRYGYDAEQVEVAHAVFELHGLFYQEVPFEVRSTDGWLTVDRSDASVELSLELLGEDGRSTTVWGDFPITDTIALP